jgi:hypothetical protein
VGFDIAGASNSTCTLVLANPIITAIAQFNIGAPSPPVASTNLDTRVASKTCVGITDAKPVSAQGPSGVSVTVTRSSTAMCVQTGDLRTTLGYASTDTTCPTNLTLTCEGVVLYDHTPWSICH